MVYQRREYPEWSWSFSRSRLFLACKRKYYYHYYAAHNGWERSSPPLARQAYRLKKLTNLYLVFGEAMHQAASHAVRQAHEQPVTRDCLIDYVRAKLNRAYLSSQRKQRWMQYPNRYLMLSEFYYGDGLSQRQVEQIKSRIPVCAEHLLASKTMQELRGISPDDILENDDAQPFEYSGSKVYAIPDLVYRSPQGKMVIVDWKTGQDAEDHAQQLALYGLYAKLRHGWPQAGCLGRMEYLDKGTHEEMFLDQAALDRARDLLQETRAQMQSLLADEEKNQPLSQEHFPLTESRGQCRSCQFFELCREALAQEEKSG